MSCVLSLRLLVLVPLQNHVMSANDRLISIPSHCTSSLSTYGCAYSRDGCTYSGLHALYPWLRSTPRGAASGGVTCEKRTHPSHRTTPRTPSGEPRRAGEPLPHPDR